MHAVERAHFQFPPTSAHDEAHFGVLEDDIEVGEDSIIVDDLEVFPGWDLIGRMRPSGRVFQDAGTGRRLTVLLANKNAIELTTGVDLVYFIHRYSAFVLVQYKHVRREGEAAFSVSMLSWTRN